MNVSLWPLGLQQDMPVHQHCLTRHLSSASRRFNPANSHNQAPAQIRCRAHTQQVADRVGTDGASAEVAEPSSSNGIVAGAVQPSTAYPFTEIEEKWQHHWLQHKTFATPDLAKLDTSKPKFYALDMYAHPLLCVSDRASLEPFFIGLIWHRSTSTTLQRK